MRLLVGVEAPLPGLLGAFAGVAGVPALVYRLRNLKGGVRPADRRPRSGDLVCAERRAVRGAGVGLLRRALGDDRLGADQRRARLFALRLLDGGVDRLDIVAVDVRD